MRRPPLSRRCRPAAERRREFPDLMRNTAFNRFFRTQPNVCNAMNGPLILPGHAIGATSPGFKRSSLFTVPWESMVTASTCAAAAPITPYRAHGVIPVPDGNVVSRNPRGICNGHDPAECLCGQASLTSPVLRPNAVTSASDSPLTVLAGACAASESAFPLARNAAVASTAFPGFATATLK